MNGRILDEVRGEMEDPPSLGRRRSNRLDQYDSWSKYLAYTKQPEKYTDTVFVIGFSSLIMSRPALSVTYTMNPKYIISVLPHLLMWLRYVSSNQWNTTTPPSQEKYITHDNWLVFAFSLMTVTWQELYSRVFLGHTFCWGHDNPLCSSSIIRFLTCA